VRLTPGLKERVGAKGIEIKDINLRGGLIRASIEISHKASSRAGDVHFLHK
jgi:hypothetical protein